MYFKHDCIIGNRQSEFMYFDTVYMDQLYIINSWMNSPVWIVCELSPGSTVVIERKRSGLHKKGKHNNLLFWVHMEAVAALTCYISAVSKFKKYNSAQTNKINPFFSKMEGVSFSFNFNVGIYISNDRNIFRCKLMTLEGIPIQYSGI